MDTRDIEVIPAEQPSFETSSHANRKTKRKSNERRRRLSNYTIHISILSMTSKIRRTKYTACFLVKFIHAYFFLGQKFFLQYHFRSTCLLHLPSSQA